MSDQAQLAPMPDADPEAILAIAVLENARGVYVTLLGMLDDTDPMRVLHLIDTHTQGTKKLLAQLRGESSRDRNEEMNEGFGSAIGGFGLGGPGGLQDMVTEITDMLGNQTRGSQVDSLVSALGKARKQKDEELMTKLQAKIDGLLGNEEPPTVIEMAPVVAARNPEEYEDA